MAFHVEPLVIPSGQSVSNEWDLESSGSRRAVIPVIQSISGTDPTVTVEWKATAAASFSALRAAGASADVSVAPNQAQLLPEVPGGRIRLKASAAVGADKTWYGQATTLN